MTKIIAHRGSSGHYPENTMLAFEMAVKDGADGIETDVRKTKDGVLVIMHDNNFKRISDNVDPAITVTDSTYDELKDIDISSKAWPDHPVQHIVTLDSLLQLVKESGIELNIEIKSNTARIDGAEYDIVELVKKYGLDDKVFYSSFDHTLLANIKNRYPEVKVAPLYSETIYNVWEYCKSFDAFAIHPNFAPHLTHGNSEECLKAGLEINAWTVNKAEDAKRLVADGVTGLITNYPVEIRKSINE